MIAHIGFGLQEKSQKHVLRCGDRLGAPVRSHGRRETGAPTKLRGAPGAVGCAYDRGPCAGRHLRGCVHCRRSCRGGPLAASAARHLGCWISLPFWALSESCGGHDCKLKARVVCAICQGGSSCRVSPDYRFVGFLSLVSIHTGLLLAEVQCLLPCLAHTGRGLAKG